MYSVQWRALEHLKWGGGGGSRRLLKGDKLEQQMKVSKICISSSLIIVIDINIILIFKKAVLLAEVILMV